jgi:DNA-binding XRE family transcriptional regulator
MLNYFKGGPLDNCVYETSMLLTSPTEPGLKSLSEYNWTPELKTSETTGKVARVWVHGSLFIPGSVSPVPVKPAGSIQRVAPTQNTKKEQRPMSDLKDRRVALGVSRAKVADAAGLTQAKLYRIENEGKKNTDEEVAQVSEALDRLEAERPAATEPEPVPSE